MSMDSWSTRHSHIVTYKRHTAILEFFFLIESKLVATHASVAPTLRSHVTGIWRTASKRQNVLHKSCTFVQMRAPHFAADMPKYAFAANYLKKMTRVMPSWYSKVSIWKGIVNRRFLKGSLVFPLHIRD